MNSIFYLQMTSFCKSLFSLGYLLNAFVNTCKFVTLMILERNQVQLKSCEFVCHYVLSFLNIMSILALVLPFYMLQIWDIIWSCIYGFIY